MSGGIIIYLSFYPCHFPTDWSIFRLMQFVALLMVSEVSIVFLPFIPFILLLAAFLNIIRIFRGGNFK